MKKETNIYYKFEYYLIYNQYKNSLDLKKQQKISFQIRWITSVVCSNLMKLSN